MEKHQGLKLVLLNVLKNIITVDAVPGSVNHSLATSAFTSWKCISGVARCKMLDSLHRNTICNVLCHHVTCYYSSMKKARNLREQFLRSMERMNIKMTHGDSVAIRKVIKCVNSHHYPHYTK